MWWPQKGKQVPTAPCIVVSEEAPPAPEPWGSKHLALSTTTPCWPSGFQKRKRGKRSHPNVWIICSQTVSSWALVGLRLDAGNEATDCKNIKKLSMGQGMCSGRIVSSHPSARLFSISERCLVDRQPPVTIPASLVTLGCCCVSCRFCELPKICENVGELWKVYSALGCFIRLISYLPIKTPQE